MDEEKGKRIRGSLNSYATIVYTLNFFSRIYENLNGHDLTVYEKTGLWDGFYRIIEFIALTRSTNSYLVLVRI